MPKILVADDNPVSLRFFSEAIAQIGFECLLARDGGEAAALARRSRFDLLLLDARMPVLDGAHVLARVRAELGPSRDAQAIATTAEPGEVVRRSLLEAGFVEVIAKPVTLDALRTALGRHLPARDVAEGPREEPAGDRSLDDERALAAVGGDRSILAALRSLLVAELDALPAEIAAIASRADLAALRDRLHRLDASAGFCGAPALAQAGARLRTALGEPASWPHAATAEFLAACARVRTQLVDSTSRFSN